MSVTNVRVQNRVPGFEEKSLVVIGFETNDLDVIKVHVVAEMAFNFGVLIKTCHCFFVLRCWGLLMTFLFGHSTQNYTEQLILYIMPDFWRSESSSSLGRGKRLLMVKCGL